MRLATFYSAAGCESYGPSRLRLLLSRQMRHTLSTADAADAGKPYIVALDVVGRQIVMVNIFFIGAPASWVLVDAADVRNSELGLAGVELVLIGSPATTFINLR